MTLYSCGPIQLFLVVVLLIIPTLRHRMDFHCQPLCPGTDVLPFSSSQNQLPSANCPFSTFPATPTERLPPSTSQCRGRVLATSLLSSAMGLDPLCPSAASMTPHVGLHTAASHFLLVPSVRRECHLPPSASWFCGGATSALSPCLALRQFKAGGTLK